MRIVIINAIAERTPDSETSVKGFYALPTSLIVTPLTGMWRHIMSRLFLPHHDKEFLINFGACRFARSILNIITAKQPIKALRINM